VSSQLRRQNRSEQRDGLLRQTREMMERWEKRITFDNPALAERYDEAELRLVIELLIGHSSLDPIKLLAIFERLPICDFERNRDAWNNRSVRRCPRREGSDDGRVVHCDCEQQSVFVSDIETVKTPEVGIPTFVRLEISDDLDCVLRDASLYLGQAAGFKFVPAVEDWEAVSFAGRLVVGKDELPDEQIERGSEVVNRVAKDSAHAVRGLCPYRRAIDNVSRVRFLLTDRFVGIRLQEPLDRGVELVDVLVGPFDFRMRSLQQLGHEAILT
jgi:hypothetical protein